jgi:phage virion morphogenesis protein
MIEVELKYSDLLAALTIDTTAIVEQVSKALLENTLARFKAEMSPTGVKWVPSKAAIRRKAKGISGGTLYNTGALFSSIKIVGRGVKGSSIVSTSPYASKHQFGIDVIAREFLGVSDSDISTVNNILKARIKDFVK